MKITKSHAVDAAGIHPLTPASPRLRDAIEARFMASCVAAVLLAAIPAAKAQPAASPASATSTNTSAATTSTLASSAALAPEFLGVVSRQLPLWDLNHDGELQASELDAAIEDPRVKGSTAAALATLKRASRGVKGSPPTTLTLPAIQALVAQGKAAKPNMPSMYRDSLKRITGAASRELFASGLPRLSSIHQGRLGNCFCLAPLGAMVSRDPSQVAAMYAPQPDGTCKVTFGKASACVAAPTDAEIALTSSNEQDGVWVNLYEKALGAARNAAAAQGKRVGLDIDSLAKGGSAGTMLAYLTGHEIERYSFAFAKATTTTVEQRAARLADLRAKLSLATTERRLMTCGTRAVKVPGLTPNHAYAVLGYDAATDKVRLWNPHGGAFTPKPGPTLDQGYAMADGVFQVPVDEFALRFSGMAFEMLPAAPPVAPMAASSEGPVARRSAAATPGPAPIQHPPASEPPHPRS